MLTVRPRPAPTPTSSWEARAGPKPGAVVVSVEDSSQFASALLLSSAVGQWTVDTPEDANPDELPYVESTQPAIEPEI